MPCLPRVRPRTRLALLPAAVLLVSFQITAAPPPVYVNEPGLARKIKALVRAHKDVLRSRRLSESAQGREVWLLELGTGPEEDRKVRPAMLVVAGAEGNDLAGTASVLYWVEHLLSQQATNTSVQTLLKTTSIYVVPRLNPDAVDTYFAEPKREATTNDAPMDDDHDGLADEDGPEDLNGDGRITWMRIEDPEGDFIQDASEPRLLIPADRGKGEKGTWKLLSEGKDNDGDEAWNEDGPGGINFNRNFPYGYRFFAAGAGQHQVSEAETRALADFVVDHPNIGITFTFGAADNLMKVPKSEGGGKRPPTAIQDDDLPYYRELGKAWREALGISKELAEIKEPGTFSDWLYFHRGRFSLAAPAWSPALQLELAKAPKKESPEANEGKDAKPEGKADKPAPDADKASDKKPEEKKSESKKPEPDKRNEEERAFLHWLDKHSPESFIAWEPFKHPDFPDQKVEVGGFAPFAKSNPPEFVLADLLEHHAAFLTGLAGKFPRLAWRKVELKHLGDSVYDLTVHVENTGYLPTSLSQGQTARVVAPTHLLLDVDAKAILSGTRRVSLGTIPGSGGMREARWVFLGHQRRDVELQAESTLAGVLKKTIELKESK